MHLVLSKSQVRDYQGMVASAASAGSPGEDSLLACRATESPSWEQIEFGLQPSFPTSQLSLAWLDTGLSSSREEWSGRPCFFLLPTPHHTLSFTGD